MESNIEYVITLDVRIQVWNLSKMYGFMFGLYGFL